MIAHQRLAYTLINLNATLYRNLLVYAGEKRNEIDALRTEIQTIKSEYYVLIHKQKLLKRDEKRINELTPKVVHLIFQLHKEIKENL